MRLALLIVVAVAAILLVLSRASEPSMVLEEHRRTQAAEATVAVQATQIVSLRSRVPTVRPCYSASPYYYSGSC